jgi:hypothetical protein
MIRTKFCVALVGTLLLASVALAANSVTATATDAGSGIISVSGSTTLDACYSVNTAVGAKVEVFLQGSGVNSFTVSLACDGTFSGSSPTNFAAGTYYVRVSVWIVGPGPSEEEYSYFTSVTLQ